MLMLKNMNRTCGLSFLNKQVSIYGTASIYKGGDIIG